RRTRLLADAHRALAPELFQVVLAAGAQHVGLDRAGAEVHRVFLGRRRLGGGLVLLGLGVSARAPRGLRRGGGWGGGAGGGAGGGVGGASRGGGSGNQTSSRSVSWTHRSAARAPTRPVASTWCGRRPCASPAAALSFGSPGGGLSFDAGSSHT